MHLAVTAFPGGKAQQIFEAAELVGIAISGLEEGEDVVIYLNKEYLRD